MSAESDAGRRPVLSLVVPVFNEEEGIAAFHERATGVLRALEGLDHELIYVNDGCTDGSQALLAEFAAADEHVSVIKFSRNFGHQIAITAGLDHATGDCVVVIDSDLQDPPELIPEMVAAWRKGHDVVYARREARAGESRFKLLTAALFYRALAKMTRIEIPADVGDFRLISRRAANHLRGLREKDRFVRGLVSWIGFPQTAVSYAREARVAGETKYPLRKMMKFALDGITSFSTVPLRLATWLGYAASLLAFLYLLSVPVQYLFDITVPGFSTIMVAVLFLGGTQLICLGIIGEYVGRIFNETKPRPMYIVEEIVGPLPPRGDRDRRDAR